MSTQYTIKTENRDRLYYDKFQYSFHFRQTEVFALRGLPEPAAMMKFINRRKEWMTSLVNYKHKQNEYFTVESIEHLLATRELLSNHPQEFKLTCSGDWAFIYTNDLNLADRLSRLPYVSFSRYIKQAVVNREKDIIVIANPQYRYRTFLRERKMKSAVKQQLLNWLQSQNYQNQVHARPSKSLLEWLKNQQSSWRSDWCMRHYYIEHDDLQYETMISMVAPGYVRKTMAVVNKLENLPVIAVDK